MRFLVLLASLVIPNELSIKDEWNNYKVEYLKKYDNAFEERDRFDIYMKNRALVEEHNRRYDLGKETYTMALNQFADMRPEEIAATVLNLQQDDQGELFGDIKPSTYIPPFGVDLPSSIDWRAFGAVTRVKNQGSCGSCWAFAATGALEGQRYRKTKQLISLSEQNLVDCSRAYGNYGCNGGFPNRAYTYIMYNGGIDRESSYPYEGVDGACRYKPKDSAATARGYSRIQYGDENSLEYAVASVGPIAVTMDATNLVYYKGGIYSYNKCNRNNRNHAVLIVGYGTSSNGTDYWLIKNSWGSRWGEQGYFRMIRNVNHCGIANAASYPLV